jgi:uncharacterized membrane protein YeaQ/YmgE (transglycosylase-associated protein family)
MDIVTWMLIGAIVGWAGYAYLDFNAERGALVSIVIGALGGFIGGKVIAPMFTAGALAAGDFSAPALLFAAAVAAAFLAAGNLIYKRWRV